MHIYIAYVLKNLSALLKKMYDILMYNVKNFDLYLTIILSIDTWALCLLFHLSLSLPLPSVKQPYVQIIFPDLVITVNTVTGALCVLLLLSVSLPLPSPKQP